MAVAQNRPSPFGERYPMISMKAFVEYTIAFLTPTSCNQAQRFALPIRKETLHLLIQYSVK
jgi:hypothetical protein